MSQNGSVTITLSSSASGGVVSYHWTDSDNLIDDTLANDMVTVQQTQVGCSNEDDTITLTVTDSYNQTATTSTSITWLPQCLG
jgi:hypothetical protein